MAKSASPDLRARTKQMEELQEKYGSQYVVMDLFTTKVNEEIFMAVKEEMGQGFLRENKVLPLFRDGNTLFVAMADPTDIQIADAITQKTGLNIQPSVAISREIEVALDDLFKQIEAALPLPNLDDTEGIPADDAQEPGFDPTGREVLS